MKHGKYLVFAILYSNLLLNEACKRGWSSILKGSQQGTVAVRENLKKKIIVLFLVLIMKKARSKRRYGDQNVDDVHGQDEDCGIYTIG